MTDGDYGWKLFASTGKICDYLKYRENTFSVMPQEENGKERMALPENDLMSGGAIETESKRTQEKERYERDLYGDGHGFVGNARG